MELGEEVRTCIPLPGIRVGTIGRVKEIGQLFVVVEFADARIGYYARGQLASTTDSSGRSHDARLGIGGERLVHGSHLCLLPSTKDELMRVIARYVAAGFEEGENCACVMPAAWDLALGQAMAEEGIGLDDALESGRLAIRRTCEVYYPAPEFTTRGQLQRTGEALASLAAGSERGARYFGYPGREVFNVPDWWEYELRATQLLKEHGVTAMCAYDPAGGRADHWHRAEATHPYVVKGGSVVAGIGGPGPGNPPS
jgi:hypothetical protein